MALSETPFGQLIVLSVARRGFVLKRREVLSLRAGSGKLIVDC
jgi:hypothetical protein